MDGLPAFAGDRNYEGMGIVKMKCAQHSVHPTGGSLRVFKQFAWLGVGSGKVALSRPAHQRVTQTVSPLDENRNLVACLSIEVFLYENTLTNLE